MATEQQSEMPFRNLTPLRTKTIWEPDTSIDEIENREATETSPNNEPELIYHRERVPLQAQLPLQAEEVERHVKAVVSAVDETKVRLICNLPHDRVEIEVPLALVPAECTRYGAPVWVSVETDYGVRRIKIAERLEFEPQEQPEDIAEIEAWLEEGS